MPHIICYCRNLCYHYHHHFCMIGQLDMGTSIKDVRFFLQYLPMSYALPIYYLSMYYIRFTLTYLPTKKSDIIYGCSPWLYVIAYLYGIHTYFYQHFSNFFFKQNFIIWQGHSMATANLKKSEDFMTNTTAASKYIPRRPRICIN